MAFTTGLADPKLPQGWNFPIKTNVRDTIAVNRFGYIGTIGTAYETVWANGGTYAYPSSAITMTATSSEGSADNGVEVTIYGLDENWEMASQTITLATTGTATTTTTFIRINEARITNGQSPTGTVSITNDATTYAVIPLSFGKSMNSYYTIPEGYTGYVVSGALSIAKQKEVLAKLMVRQFGGIFTAEGIIGTSGAPYHKDWVVPIQLPEKTDLEIRAKAGATTEIATVVEIILVRNP